MSRLAISESKAFLGFGVKYSLIPPKDGRRDNKGVLDSHELARRIRTAMDDRKPAPLKSVELAKACDVTPQAVYEWRKTGRVAKRYLEIIASQTGKPLEYFLGNKPGRVTTNYGISLTLEEAEAVKRLQNALPDWRLYVLGLAMEESKQTQQVLLDSMRKAVPDRRVEEHVSVAPHAASRKPVKHK